MTTTDCSPDSAAPFRYCLNTSTLSDQSLGVLAEIETAAAAGYDGIELWIPSLERFVASGGKLDGLARMAGDLGLQIENAIGFAPWVIDDPVGRRAGLDQAKREMAMLAAVGCRRIAAPPAGAIDGPTIAPSDVGARFGELAAIGRQEGVSPQLELWGFSSTLSRLDEMVAASAAVDGHVPLLLDAYHLERGGSDLTGLAGIEAGAVEVFHLNDYPKSIPRGELTDADRVYPGDGDAPLSKLIGWLAAVAPGAVLSLELFNRNLWTQNPPEVARTGLERMKEAVSRAT